MFSDVITRRPRFVAEILESLVDGPIGTHEIARKIGVDRSGNITRALCQLEEAGFVSADAGINPETGEETKDRHYRLRDKRPGVSLRTALVYDGELAPSVEADGYIDSVVSARRILGLLTTRNLPPPRV